MTVAIWILTIPLIAEWIMAPVNLWTGRTMPLFARFTGFPPGGYGAASRKAALCDVDEDLADRSALHGVMCFRGRFQSVVVQGEPGLLPGAQCPGGDGSGDVFCRGREPAGVEGVEQQELVAQVAAESLAY